MAMIAPTVEAIGDEALTNSIIDRSITELQDNILTTIAGYALYECRSLKRAVFGAVTRVKGNAFGFCQALETVDFYQKVYIESLAFRATTVLSALILRSETMCTLDASNEFTTAPIGKGTGYIYVPAALVDSYKAASGWSTYASQIRAIEDYPEVCDPYSWVAVSKAIENGTYKDVYKIGDEVPVDLGAQGVINMQIAAFDADTLADGSGTAAISWVCMHGVGKGTPYHSVNPTTFYGYVGSDIEAYCKGTLKQKIPAIVRNMIVDVSKTSRYNDGSWKDEISVQDVWIPSYREVFATSKVFREASGAEYTSLFVDDASRKLTRTDASGSTYYPLRSRTGDYVYYVYGQSGKSAGAMEANKTNNVYVVFGFCTGRTPA